MFYGALPSVFAKARYLREHGTEAENILCMHIGQKQIRNLKFRRQHPISCFIADFYCHEAKIVIEVDGSIHDLDENKEYDIVREEYVVDLGIKVIRFTNEEVLKNIDGVVKRVDEFVEKQI